MPKQMSRHSSILKTPRHGRKLTPHPGEPSHGPLTAEELQLAARNHSMPLEALRNDTTPPGLHYLLNHFDIPFIDAEHWHLRIGGAVQRSLELNLKALRAVAQDQHPRDPGMRRQRPLAAAAPPAEPALAA